MTRKKIFIILFTFAAMILATNIAFAAEHVHEYTEVVTPPTCNSRGYTTHTCACGDSYVNQYTDPIPHDYGDNGYCIYGCGYYRMEAPEDAQYLYVTCDAPGKISAAKQDDFYDGYTYYHILIPEAAKGFYVTYAGDKIASDNWGYGHASAFNPLRLNEPPDNVTFKVRDKSDGTKTMYIPASEYEGESPERAKKIVFMHSMDEGPIEAVSVEYDIPEGYYHVIKSSTNDYSVEGDSKATNGYKFTVSPKAGITPGAHFFVTVNGEVVAEEPGEITVPEVTENLYIKVEDPDVIVKFDLSSLEDASGTLSASGTDKNWEHQSEKKQITPGGITEAAFDARFRPDWGISLSLDDLTKTITGWSVNGKYYSGYSKVLDIVTISPSSTGIRISFDFWLGYIWGLPTGHEDEVRATTWVVKPVFECDGEHEWVDATCDDPKTCRKCNMPDGEALGHEWDEGTITIEPTIGAKGEITYVCAHDSDHKKIESIDKVDASELETAVQQLEEALEGLDVSETGEDLAPGSKFITLELKDSIDTRIASANAVLSNEDSKKNDVDNALTELASAKQDLEEAIQESIDDPADHEKTDLDWDNAVDVRFTVTKDRKFIKDVNGKAIAINSIKVPYFDLANYGLESLYYNPECYSGGTAATQKAGTKEIANGHVTMLHLLIYATEMYRHGLLPTEAGLGYLAEEGWPDFKIKEDPGSAFFTFWDFDIDLNYYLNYEYPIGRPGWGATCDQIELTDGDVVSVRYMRDTGNEKVDGTFYHFNEDAVSEKTIMKGNNTPLSLFKTTKTADFSGTGHVPVGTGFTVTVSNEVGGDPIVTAQTDEYGDVLLNTSELPAGNYYVTSNSFDPAVMVLTITGNKNPEDDEEKDPGTYDDEKPGDSTDDDKQPQDDSENQDGSGNESQNGTMPSDENQDGTTPSDNGGSSITPTGGDGGNGDKVTPADGTAPDSKTSDEDKQGAEGADAITTGTEAVVKGSRYVVIGEKTAALKKAKNVKSFKLPKTVKLADGKTYKVVQINAKAFTGKKIRTVTVSANVKKLAKNAFRASKAKKLIVKTKLLKKKSVKGCLKGSKIKKILVKVGKKKINNKFIKKYKKIFTKKNAGRKVRVK